MQLESSHARLGLGIAALLFAAPSLAALKDRGPVDPATGFPVWYRDNGIPATATSPAVPPQALELCLAQTPSPNAAALGAPMCFPWAPDPAAFPGNIGDEQFWAVGDAIAAGAFGTARLVTALEAAYATGAPVRGQEISFARIRLVVDTAIAGDYVITHPFGVEIFPAVGVGARAIAFTEDVGATGIQFDGALAGRVGPFLRWDALAPGEQLTVVNAAGQLEEYLGDPNIAHTVTGSPFGTNFLQVDVYEAGTTNLIATSTTNLFTVVGKKYLQPIPSPLKIQRATYSRDPAAGTGGASSLDVFAQANPGQQLIVSGAGLTNVAMTSSGTSYLSHAVMAVGAAIPSQVTVTNTSDVPPSVFTASVTDMVTITDAVYDPAAGTLVVTATSSDQAAPPALVVSGLGPMTAGVFTSTTAGPVPPDSVTVTSSAGGLASRPVRLALTGGVVVGTNNVATNDAVVTDMNTAVTFSVTANDTILTPVASINVLAPPAHGTLVAGAALGDFTYTPALNYSGPDSFSYTLTDTAGAISAAATVSITVNFVAVPPVANNDILTTTAGVPNTLAILANDTAAFGTTINPNSVVLGAVTPATAGTLTWSAATQLVTFTPAAGFTGTASATYTVQNNFAQPSNTATITLQVNAAAEVINIVRAQYRTGTGLWRVDGTSTVAQGTVTIYNGTTTAAPVLVTGVPIVAGAFTWTSATGAPAPNASRLILIRSSNGGQRVAAVTVRQ